MNPQRDVCLIRLEINRVGVNRQLDGEDATQAFGRSVDPKVVKATKKLWDCAEYDEVNTVCNKARAVIKQRCVPAPYIGKGFALMLVERYPIVDADLKVVRDELGAAVDRFVAVYPQRVAESQAELLRNGIPFDPSEYPSPEQVRDGFAITWSPLDFSVPEALAKVDEAAFSEAKAEAAERFETTMKMIEQCLILELKTLTDSMVERLDTKPGEKKIFRDSLVTNLREWLAEAPFRNISNSQELTNLCERASMVLGNLSPDELRNYRDAREVVATGMKDVSARLDECLINKPTRKVLRMPAPLPTVEASELSLGGAK